MIFVFIVCLKKIFLGITKVREAHQKLEGHNKIGGSAPECL